MAMDTNTVEFHIPPAETQVSGLFQAYEVSNPLSLNTYFERSGFLAQNGRVVFPQEETVNQIDSSDIDYNSPEFHRDNQTNADENLVEREYIEVHSKNGIYVRIPSDIFTFSDAEAQDAFYGTAKAFLDSISGYIEFSQIYANAQSFGIPNSPAVISEMVWRLINELKANEVPITGVPYVHKPALDPYAPQVSSSIVNVTQEDGSILSVQCEENQLASGIQVCQPEDSAVLAANHYIATALMAIGRIAQEYPANEEMDIPLELSKYFGEVRAKFFTVESIEKYLKDKKDLEEFWKISPTLLDKKTRSL